MGGSKGNCSTAVQDYEAQFIAEKSNLAKAQHEFSIYFYFILSRDFCRLFFGTLQLDIRWMSEWVLSAMFPQQFRASLYVSLSVFQCNIFQFTWVHSNLFAVHIGVLGSSTMSTGNSIGFIEFLSIYTNFSKTLRQLLAQTCRRHFHKAIVKQLRILYVNECNRRDLCVCCDTLLRLSCHGGRFLLHFT